ncbi:MAG: hypothetical protein IPJ85_18080 [Flavobacteriales bacterium]|nr:hypothetical protein [Flavobacteriales bacterium]
MRWSLRLSIVDFGDDVAMHQTERCDGLSDETSVTSAPDAFDPSLSASARLRVLTPR